MLKRKKDVIGIRRYRMMLLLLLLAVIMVFASYIFCKNQNNKKVRDATLVKAEVQKFERKK